MNRITSFLVFSLIALLFCSSACKPKQPVVTTTNDTYSTNPTRKQKVVIVVMDGPRYSETWGDNSHQYIPHMFNDMAPNGSVYTNFSNQGETFTMNGHTAITTGFHQSISNDGWSKPAHASIFQLFLKEHALEAQKAWLITSKDKLEVLANSDDSLWNNQFLCSTNCGVSGLHSGYRNDSITCSIALQVLKEQQPNLVLINFREPDYSGHNMDWQGYLKGIVDVDTYAWKIWSFLQTDPYYRNSTTFFMTNDHGRHLDGIHDGYVSHGDQCDGCTHINLFASGPTIKPNAIINKKRSLVDLHATVCSILGITAESQGQVMNELFY